ncbi:hypothetical protein M758_6G142000 [Ceratodon purpureus]|nr:hypothetical protein M758_6G142000 [Ceratodon purpureus]KAG0613973.1 hypothetical protein M758_6G142000 [Ceratodon purpureus]KAG0613974.1 hypothetical protein M758_6G142000 [Ceratodon purpureus]KAG0613975.1 hypothetical protein M758_6G142000 [Ceratodon purpureus]KAG0613976.1 hypothetical protein M758_6G142000 [Ceratodon purpureus]
MAVSGKGKGKAQGEGDEADEGRKLVRDMGKKAVLDKGKNVVPDDDEEEEYFVDEAEEDGSGYSSGENIKVTRRKRNKRYKEHFELDEDDYDLLEDHNVTGFRRPPNLGGKFKRLKKLGHVGNDSGTVPQEIFEEEESEDDEEMEDDVSEEEVGEYESLSKLQKKGGKQAQRKGAKSRRGVRNIDKTYKPPLVGRKRFDREALAALNEEEVDSDDNNGDDEETLTRRLLEKQFEPSLRELNSMTARDVRLRQTDIPERLQILEEETADVLPSSDLELRQAAEWIFDRAFGDQCVPSCPEFQHLLSLEKPVVVRQIANVLHLVHNEKLEVPFIGLYRCEECLDLLNEPTDGFSSFDEGPTIQQYKALWAVQEWDKKWLLIQRRKSILQVNFKERISGNFSSIPEKVKIAENIFRFLEDAESEQAIDDCEAQFNLHFPVDESEITDCGFKRPRFRSLYSIGHQAGLGKITKYFGLTSEAFGDNVKAGYKRNGILDEAFLPDDVAAKFFNENPPNAEFRDPASFLRGARHMLAMEFSTEPLVREHVRAFYSKNALVTTRPTPVGIGAIDAFHQFKGVKWIDGKLISAFDDEQWLLIQKAEEEKLIDVTVGLSKESIETILFDFEQFFSSDGLSRTSPTWSEQRKQILQEAVVTLLLPIMEKEIRMSLVVRAKQVLAAKCGLQLWNKVSVAPPKLGNLDYRNQDGPALRVLACCWGPPRVGTTFVMLDVDGEILNIMHTGYLNIKAVSLEQKQRKESDQGRLMQLLLDYKPHFIVLGAARVQCRYLSQEISDVLFKFAEEHAGDSSEGSDSTTLVYGDEFIPSLFEASSISQKQLPGKQGDVRRAVALGRFLQNPVAMVASLCGPSKEVLSIKFHPLQSFLSEEELFDIVERVMVTVVNQVGIDINLALMHDWLFETLQFVAGLGPRKAEEIRITLQTVGRVYTRDDLYSTTRAMDGKVFTNSAGFIRVRGIGQTSSDIRQSEPLDDTRIHPEWYQMAKNLAEAAIEKEARRNNEVVDDDVLQMAAEHVMKNPNVLDSVDIEEYAQSVHVEGQNKRIKALDFIKSELQRGFQEWRRPYSEPSKEECFYLMTGESEETLFEGRIVQATVRKVQEHQVMCVLECGLLGFIQKEDISDDGNVEPKDKFTEGSSVTCRVKEVKKDKYLVDLTCKESDLREDSSGDLHHRDKRFKPDTTLLDEQEKTRKEKEDRNKKTFKTRPIVHPKFQNLSTDDAIKVLIEKDMGDFIIHPSSKGPAHLSIALKLSDGLFSHIDIAEGGKENWDLASFLRLGKTLTIGDDSYKSLDEVISKHVNQIVIHLNAILQYRKYKQGNTSEIADALRSEKTEKPKCIPYCISIAHEYPGAFMLSYIRATNCYHEYISLVPNGFRFRKNVFDTIEKLVVYFQSHFHDPIPEPSSRGKGRGRGNGSGEKDEKTQGVCYAFQRGDCSNGDSCRFLHEKQEERPRRVCYAFQRGDCPNGDDCKFLHEKQEERPRRVCYAFQRGDCPNGDDCKFLHEKQEGPEVCRAFQRGDCSRGDSCRFAHSEKDDSRPREVCRAFQRGDCSRGDSCRFAHGSDGAGDGGRNGTINSFQSGHDWNSDAGNENWGDDRGNTSDTKGNNIWNDAAEAEDDGWGATKTAGGGGGGSDTKEKDAWNDAADGGLDSGWADKGVSSNTEPEADGWGATNSAGGGGGGWGATKSAGGGGGGSDTKEKDAWNDAADGGLDSGWGDKGVSSNTEPEADGWGATNTAGGGGGGWDDWNASADGEGSKGGGWDSATDPADGGRGDATKAPSGDGGAAWGEDRGLASHTESGDHVWSATANAANGTGGWGSSDRDNGCSQKDEKTQGVCYAFQRGDCPNGDGCRFLHKKQDERPRGVCYSFQRGDCSNGDSCRFLHEKQEEKPRGVCYAFQRGDCSNGDSCRFLHEKQEERPRRVCYAFQRGDCPNGDDCKFLHEKQEERPRGVCYAFQRGDCSRGDSCRFSHEKQEGRVQEVCRAFQRGDCSRGDSCRFAHDKQDDSRPREVCRAFQRGDCSRGDSCRYAHDKQDDSRPREVCRAFQRGDCSRGDSCRYAHDKQDDSRPREVCRAFQRGDCSRGDGCRFAHAEEKTANAGRGSDGAGDGGRNGTTNSIQSGHDWNSDAGNENWGDDRGNTSDTKGKGTWNDAAEAEDDGWGATNTAGGGWDDWNASSAGKGSGPSNAASKGGGGGWDDWNASSAGEGSGPSNAASKGGGGGWDDWNASSAGEGSGPSNAASKGGGWDAKKVASGDGGAACDDNRGLASHTESGDHVWSATTNAASGTGGWDIVDGGNDSSKGKNVTKISGDNTSDGKTESIGREIDGWD